MIIHANVYDPSRPSIFKTSKNERAECQTIDCSNHEQCDLYRRGQCANRKFIRGFCPYGREHVVQGYTRRARKFRKWVSEYQGKYADVPFLDAPNNKLAFVGDFVYLPYSHMNKQKPLSWKGCFIPKTEFTVENIKALCEFRPQVLFGGEIKFYQSESVRRFVLHLSEICPVMYDDLCKIYPQAEGIVESHSNIGRKAVLSTIKPNVGVVSGIHKDDWVWDGTYLTMVSGSVSFLPVRYSEVRIKPVEGEIVKICSDDQVGEDTVFVD